MFRCSLKLSAKWINVRHTVVIEYTSISSNTVLFAKEVRKLNFPSVTFLKHKLNKILLNSRSHLASKAKCNGYIRDITWKQDKNNQMQQQMYFLLLSFPGVLLIKKSLALQQGVGETPSMNHPWTRKPSSDFRPPTKISHHIQHICFSLLTFRDGY